ncbi:MAG: galactosyldiacylglycerol synthase [Burkholderiaceae bacterium]|nr:galactosyldiacylglycerol synthase [Burkholderiaceae bacterium]
MTQRKILLLSVSAGAGHTRAAEALRAIVCTKNCGVTATHLDVMHYVTRSLHRLYVDFYIFLVQRAPGLWGLLYRITNNAKPDGLAHRFRRWFERLNSKPLLRKIAEFQPDAVVCTHFLPAEILSGLIASGRLNCPVWVQVTDFDLHSMWVQPHMTGYFAPNEEVAFGMRENGIDATAIHVTGIPIMEAFSAPLDRTVCARELGIDPNVPTLLLMGGGAGLGSLTAIAGHLLGLQENFQLVVMAGKNEAALAALQKLAQHYPGRLTPHGYTNQVERLMACADLAITKPGGLSTSECLAMGLPMILNAPIPGQEEHNANYLLEEGAAVSALIWSRCNTGFGICWPIPPSCRRCGSRPGRLAALAPRITSATPL